jgi:hypothetical protein
MESVNHEWHNDGHQIKLVVERGDVVVSMAFCPNGRKEGTNCWNARAQVCVVAYFVDRYGLDTNVGVAPASSLMDIAWSFEGDVHDIDASQVWIIPLSDVAFSGWLADRPGLIES